MDVRALVLEAARRHGVPEDLALDVAHRESRFNQAAVSPKGARGVMQLMPGTASDLGVDAGDIHQNIDGGVRYLKQQLVAFGGDKRLAKAAYNAGPTAVRRYGGVPPYAETQAYVGDKPGGASVQDGFDGASIFGMTGNKGGQQSSEGFDGAAIFADAAPKPQPKPKFTPPPAMPARASPSTWAGPRQPMPQRAPVAAPRSTAADMGLGAVSGTTKGLAGVQDTILQAGPMGQLSSAFTTMGNLASVLRGRAPGGIQRPFAPNAARADANGYKPQTDAGRATEAVFTMAPNALIPGSAAGRVANVVLPAAGQQGARMIARAAGGDENAQEMAGMGGAFLGGVASGVRLSPRGAKLPTADLAGLDTAQQAAWAKVNASPYRFGASDSSAAARDVSHIVAEADPDLYPDSAKWAAKLERMAQRGELTLGKLNTLKSQMGVQIGTGKEAPVGQAMIQRVEELINTAKDPSLTAAREAYKRFMKVKDVTERLDDAALARNSTGTGGNTNAPRQALKPLVKNKSQQRMRNATPDEVKAIKRVVNGGPMENVLRVLSAADPFKGKLSAMLQGGFQSQALIPSGGLSLLVPAAGMAASHGEKAIQAHNVQSLLDLMASGGVKPSAPALRAAPYAGAAAVTSPLLIGAPASASPRRPKKLRRQ